MDFGVPLGVPFGQGRGSLDTSDAEGRFLPHLLEGLHAIQGLHLTRRDLEMRSEKTKQENKQRITRFGLVVVSHSANGNSFVRVLGRALFSTDLPKLALDAHW